MHSPESQNSKHNRRIKKCSVFPVTLALLVLAGVAGAILFFSSSPSAVSAANEKLTVQSPISGNSAPLTTRQSSPATSSPLATSTHIEEQYIPAKTDTTGEPDEQIFQTSIPGNLQLQQQQCSQLADRLHSFFSSLDQKEYIQEFQLGVPAQQYFLELTTKLLNNPPVVSRESDDLYTILKNMAHFFRVIGGKNILIIKGILDRERENIEDVAADLFLWTTGEECSDDTFSFKAPVDKLYEYAGFFLNSMGGRSYLFRRDSRSRLLVNYYSILLINRANKEGINQHGIDIKPLLPITTNEIESSNQLIYKEDYLDGLYELMEQYQ
jgi:hypothetical protein